VSQFGLTAARLERLIELLEQASVFLPEPSPITICRDPRDDVFIAAAVAAGADFLVSRDDDLKADPAVSDYLADSGVTVLTVRRFLSALGG
jgi:putative PIN family toxin of toxin-antitoxin system